MLANSLHLISHQLSLWIHHLNLLYRTACRQLLKSKKKNMTPKSLSCLREDAVQPCPAQFSHQHSQLGIQSITMAWLGWHFIHSPDDLMPRLHWGISDYLTAMLDGNQEAPPRDTNAGSDRRITSHSLFFHLFKPSLYLTLFLWQHALLLSLLSFCFCFIL